MQNIKPTWQKQRRITRQHHPRRYLWSPNYLSGHVLFAALKKAVQKFDGLVLDIGCGNQPYRAWFGETQVIGLDPDWLDSQPNTVGLAQELPFADNTFDGVFSAQTLEHVSEPWEMMAEMARVLKPGGYLVLSAPQSWRVHEPPHDYYRFTKYGLRYLAEKNGLIVEKAAPLNSVWGVVGQTLLNIFPHRQLFHLTAPLNLVINSIFSLLDRIWPEQRDTLNNILIARKPISD